VFDKNHKLANDGIQQMNSKYFIKLTTLNGERLTVRASCPIMCSRIGEPIIKLPTFLLWVDSDGISKMSGIETKYMSC
jgi:hypothetical protein